MKISNYIWRDRKRPIFGLPLSFTVYTLLEDKLLIDTGILSTKQEEIKLYRIMDLTAYKTTPEFEIRDIKKPFEIKEKLSSIVEEQRDKKRVTGKEFLVGDDDDDMH